MLDVICVWVMNITKDAFEKDLKIKGISRKFRRIAEKKCREIGD